jgi:hypothetical protein
MMGNTILRVLRDNDFGLFITLMSGAAYKHDRDKHKVELASIIERYKPYVIKKILLDIKHSNDHDNVEHESYILDRILRVIKGLKELGIIWPELNIINASILHDINSHKPTVD